MMNVPADRFLSRAECSTLARYVASLARGGGATATGIDSSWTGNLRWARNRISTSGDVRNNQIGISRQIRGAESTVYVNQLTPSRLEAAVRRAERLLQQFPEQQASPRYPLSREPYQEPALWFDRTYQLQAPERTAAMRELVKPAEAAGMSAAGYIEVSAHGRAIMDGGDLALYYPVTFAQYSITVRDPQGTGSGWAGVDWNDWGRIDSTALSAIALEKCLQSRNPVAIEPGRYTTILEPQATGEFVAPLIQEALDRHRAENWPPRGPFSGEERGYSKIGERVIDKRITIGADYRDPDLGFPPYGPSGEVYQPVQWIVDGVLRELAYSRTYAIRELGQETGLPNSRAFKVSGGTATVAEMIANTKRGLLVTRFSDVQMLHYPSLLLTGLTRDGLWLIERGAISKPVKNLRFTESILLALNNVLELGRPQRIFRPGTPAVVPPLLVQDFSFTGLVDAV